uniref:Uncharacterized protein n=1 Tax=Cacopsylla melanoneura TaxID=428564 RepID=A0A8D8X2J5_9HEMI
MERVYPILLVQIYCRARGGPHYEPSSLKFGFIGKILRSLHYLKLSCSERLSSTLSFCFVKFVSHNYYCGSHVSRLYHLYYHDVHVICLCSNWSKELFATT